MIQISIIATIKGHGYGGEWTRLSAKPEQHHFPDMETAKAYLRERYGKCRQRPMYLHYENGSSKRIGWGFSFRRLHRDWVTLAEAES